MDWPGTHLDVPQLPPVPTHTAPIVLSPRGAPLAQALPPVKPASKTRLSLLHSLDFPLLHPLYFDTKYGGFLHPNQFAPWHQQMSCDLAQF